MTDPASPPAAPESAPAPAAQPFVRRTDEGGAAPRILVLVDPRGAFRSVAARPMVAVTLGVLLAFAVLPPLAFMANNDVMAVTKHELQKSGKLEQLTPEQREKLENASGKGLKVVLPIAAVAKRALWIFLVAGLSFALLRGTRPSLAFAPLLAAVALAMAPLAVHDVVGALTYVVKDATTMDAQNVVLSNPAAWFHMETGHHPLATLLRGLDFFELWSCLLVGLGASVIAGGRTSLGYVVAFSLHFVFVAVFALIAGMS